MFDNDLVVTCETAYPITAIKTTSDVSSIISIPGFNITKISAIPNKTAIIFFIVTTSFKNSTAIVKVHSDTVNSSTKKW